MEQAPAPQRPPGFKWWLALLPIALLTVLLYWFMGRKPAQPEPEAVEASAFNVQDVPKAPAPAAAPAAAYLSQEELEERQREAVSGPGLAGFVPERDRIFYKDQKTQDDDERVRERAFLAKNDGLILDEQRKLRRITDRYYKKEPIVREVDRAFGSLPRYMVLHDKYLKDRDAYAFFRGALALPEVRKTIYKYALNSDVWRVTVGMTLDGLRQRPPPVVYNECKRFLTDDKDVAKFVTDLTGYVTPRMGSLLPQVLRSGQDVRPLQDLAKDLNVTGNMANMNQARANVGQATRQTQQP